MHNWTVVAIFVIGIGLILAKRLTKSSSRKSEFAYRAKPLLTPATREAYTRLRAALPDRLIFAEVKVAQFLDAQGPAYQRIKELAADFVICDSTGKVTAVVEIDDRSHNKPSQRARDAKKDQACKSAGINVHRWQATKLPTPTDMSAQINATMNTVPAAN